MKMTARVKKILANYESDNPGTKANLARILMQGKLGGTGKLVILPVDQGFEHGPARSFAPNPPAYDPHYHFQLAIDAGLSAYAAPLGMIEAGADTFAGADPDHPQGQQRQQPGARQGSRPGGHRQRQGRAAARLLGDRLHHLSRLRRRLRHDGGDRASWPTRPSRSASPSVIWSYPRGGSMSKEGETAIDISAYAAHMAALLGAHIIKVKPPTDHLELEAAKKVYEKQKIDDRHAGAARIATSCSPASTAGASSSSRAARPRTTTASIDEARAIRDGGGNGSIIGRNTFQRPRDEALKLLDSIIRIYKGES